MRFGLVIFYLGILLGCSNKQLEQPEESRFNLQMATVGASRFEDYIHSLTIYAFRKTQGGEYVYHKTLAELDAEEIANLQDGSSQENSKLFRTRLAVGTYYLYLVGNASDHLSGQLTEGVTIPQDVQINGTSDGQDSIYFLGYTQATMTGSEIAPLVVTLNRAVSKLVFVLYHVPIQIDSIRMTLGNLASAVNLKGEVTEGSKTITEILPVKQTIYEHDTIVKELITLPSLTGGASFELTFYTKNGQEKTKEMPAQTLLPNRYTRVTGIVNDNPGAFLSFEINLSLFQFDYWLDYKLPDFSLKKRE